MIDNDDLNDLLRSLPREQAPDDLEPKLMRRIESIRRRSMFGVLHSAVRSEWIGGFVSAAVAGLVLAGAGQLVDHVQRSSRDEAHVQRTVAVVREAPQSVDTPSMRVPEIAPHRTIGTADAVVASTIPTTTTSARVAQRRTAVAVSGARRRVAARTAGRTHNVAPIMDTIAAARVRSRTTVPLPGSTIAPTETVDSAPRLMDESTGVGTGAR